MGSNSNLCNAKYVKFLKFSRGASLKKETKFEAKLRNLPAKYGQSLEDVINLFDPQGSRGAPVAAPKAGTRKARQVKAYIRIRTPERSSKRSAAIAKVERVES